uniref:Uncharacterized protein n=1 Tax=Arundo donax TaxID=35708 RepID=A0A0A8YMT0_ARUDO
MLTVPTYLKPHLHLICRLQRAFSPFLTD